MDNKISVIVPVYNVINYLPKCLDSIIGQTYTNLEILLVDDGSTDGSEIVCDEYELKDRRVKVIHQNNSGVSAARNRGLDEASGDFIYFSDSDDYLEVDILEQLILISDGVEIVICNFYLDFLDSRELFYKEDLNKTFSNIEAIKEIISMKDRPIFLGHMGHKLYRKKILQDVRFNSNYALYEDLLFVITAFINSNYIKYTSYCGYHYIQRSNSMMYSQFTMKTYSSIGAAAEIYNLIKTNFPDLSYNAQFLYIITNLKQATLCVYSKASIKYLKHIKNNLLLEKPFLFKLIKFSLKEKIYFYLLCTNINLFIVFYKIIIKPNRRRFERNLNIKLYNNT